MSGGPAEGWGWAADLVVTVVASRIPGTKGVVLAGLAGGAASGYLEKGTVTEAGIGAAAGLLGGTAGAFGGRALGKTLTKRATAAEEALLNAHKAKMEPLDKAVKDAQEKFDEEYRKFTARGGTGTPPTAYLDAKDALNNAKTLQAAEAAKKPTPDPNSWQYKAGRQLEMGKGRKGDTDTRTKSGWANSGLQAVGSTILVEIQSSIRDGLKGEPPAVVGTVVLILVGDHVALFGTPPFDQSSVPSGAKVEGISRGFLVQPKDLAGADGKSVSGARAAAWYAGPSNSLATTLSDNYKLLGDIKKKEELQLKELPTVIPKGTFGAADALKQYQVQAGKLDEKVKAFNALEAKMVKTLPTVEEVSKKGKEDISALIKAINTVVASVSDGTPATFCDTVQAGFEQVLNATDTARTGQDANADLIKKLATQVETLDQRLTANDKKGMEDLQGLKDMIKERTGGGEDPPGVDRPGDRDPVDNPPPAIDEPGQRSIDDALQRIKDQAAQSQANQQIPQPQIPSGLGNMGGMGMGMPPGMGMGMGMPGYNPMDMMREQEMRRAMADQRNALRDRMPNVAQPPKPAAPPPAPVAANPPPVQSTQPHGTPISNNGAPQNNAVPGKTPEPGADGKVPIEYKDGKSERVYPGAYQRLTAAIANTEATDGEAAAKGMRAEFKVDDKNVATDGPSDVVSGDLVHFAKRTGVVRAIRSGGDIADDKLEVIVCGEFVPWAPEMSDKAGDFGAFIGFVHLKDADAAAAKNGDPVPAPGSVDDQAHTVMPVIAGT